jgi:uncharacterized DUF497 family protein
LSFEWDPRKRALNLRKHGIAFEDAVELFAQPYLEDLDDRPGYGEPRFVAFGEIRGRVIAVVYTGREEKRRIISARKAAKAEIEAYYEAIYSR